jgi:molybdopterin-containing oxidoreductase family iron-sulfur binding subunit
MMMTRKYWKGLEELKETPEFLKSKEQEFPSEMSVEEFLSDDSLAEKSTARRDFLKFLGFSVAAATVAACEAPVTKAVPYVNKPENVTPGMPTWYASTYYDGNSYASILVKTREGRPIFIKGNKDFGITNGGTNPQIIASILGLYDSARLQSPQMAKSTKTWSDVDAEISKALTTSAKTVLLTGTVISPSVKKAISELSAKLGEGKFEHVQYDAVSYRAIRLANQDNFGQAIIPTYDFSKAKTVVSVGADFLGSWLMSNLYQSQYGITRNPDNNWMSKHFQFESLMSISGTNADYRGMVKPSEEANVLAYLIKGLGGSVSQSSDLPKQAKDVADKALAALRVSKGESLVVSGSNNKSIQLLTNKLNNLLGSYGVTIDLTKPVHLFDGDDSKVSTLVKNVIAGQGPDTLIVAGVNPVYSLPNGKQFGEAISKLKNTVCVSTHMDETASKCKIVCAESHALESWSDYNPIGSHYALAQPTIRPLFNTSSLLENLLVWTGVSKRSGKNSTVAHDYIQETWKSAILKEGDEKESNFFNSWNMAVHNSCFDSASAVVIASPKNNEDKKDASENPNQVEKTDVKTTEVKTSGSTSFKDVTIPALPKVNGLEVVLYQKNGIGVGAQANNPWLQELPDAVTKVTWDNYITMNPSEMDQNGYDFAKTYDQENGLSLAKLTVNGTSVTLPVYPLPGQAIGTIGVALGYGRGANGEKIGKAAFQTKEYGGHVTDEKGNPKPIGANAFSLVSVVDGLMSYNAVAEGKLQSTGEKYIIAATQIHHTVMGRYSIVRETTLDIYKSKSKEAYNPAHTLQKLDEHGNHVERPVSEFDLWDEHPVEHIGHRWGMTVDLSSCIGCGSCLVACQSENNVPVVGKDEVRRGREMHWLRIDRYFASDEEAAVGTKKDDDNFNYDKAETASLNPKVVHMPMMCHHCNHAPCETVCPVAATTHSNEGLNQMAYNRCIGTRYCANNCPYKVRRFNWFNYPSYKKFTEVNPAQDDFGRMVLNPDVTVRTRGVMEKCSFCVQRIQASKLVAKKEGRTVNDGDFTSACSDACPTNAIIVGDWNDIKSKVRKSSSDNRAYQALEEVGVKPNVWFKVKVRNEENSLLAGLQKESAHGHGSSHGTDKKDKKAHH